MTDHDELFETGLARLKDGDYWEAHEAWEDLWLDLPDETKARRATKALIQLAAICYKPEQAAGGRDDSTMQRGMGALLETAQAHLADATTLPGPEPHWDRDELEAGLDRLETILQNWRTGADLQSVRHRIARVVDDFTPRKADPSPNRD